MSLLTISMSQMVCDRLPLQFLLIVGVVCRCVSAADIRCNLECITCRQLERSTILPSFSADHHSSSINGIASAGPDGACVPATFITVKH